MFYKDTTQRAIAEVNWDEKNVVARQGGYSLDVTNLPASLHELAKGAPLSISKSGAKVIKTARLYEAATSGATSLKIEKNNIVVAGDILSGISVSAIERGESYDTISVDAISKDLAAADVIAEKIDGTAALLVATVPAKGTPDVAATLQAYEIEEDTLPYPINDEIKEALTVRHAFKI